MLPPKEITTYKQQIAAGTRIASPVYSKQKKASDFDEENGRHRSHAYTDSEWISARQEAGTRGEYVARLYVARGDTDDGVPAVSSTLIQDGRPMTSAQVQDVIDRQVVSWTARGYTLDSKQPFAVKPAAPAAASSAPAATEAAPAARPTPV